jgi:signal transduction histidine kinase
MILSDKVAGIIKGLTVESQMQKLLIDEATTRIEELLNDIEELTNSNQELRETIRDIANR